MNEDHILVILDKKQTIVDAYLAVKMDFEKAYAELHREQGTLRIVVPTLWS